MPLLRRISDGQAIDVSANIRRDGMASIDDDHCAGPVDAGAAGAAAGLDQSAIQHDG